MTPTQLWQEFLAINPSRRPGPLGRKLIDWLIWWLEASKPQPALPMHSTQ